MSSASPASDERAEGRSNVFLSATMESGGLSTSVRIRNISARGALLDADALPAVGTKIRLLRGSLSATGQLAWAGPGQGGVNFDRDIDVAGWVARVGHSGQQRVDEIVSALRGGREVGSAPNVSTVTSLPAISSALDQLCERLAQIPGMSESAGEELLKLDTLAQALRRLAIGRA